MNKLEKLKQSQSEAESDAAALGIGKQIIREERNEAWDKKWLPKFKNLFEEKLTHHIDQGKWTFETDNGFYDFYPKANKVLVRSKNEWKKPGLKFLIKTFIPDGK